MEEDDGSAPAESHAPPLRRDRNGFESNDPDDVVEEIETQRLRTLADVEKEKEFEGQDLAIRRQEEEQAVRKLDSTDIKFRDCWFMIDLGWLRRWTLFISGQEKFPPGVITNRTLLDYQEADGGLAAPSAAPPPKRTFRGKKGPYQFPRTGWVPKPGLEVMTDCRAVFNGCTSGCTNGYTDGCTDGCNAGDERLPRRQPSRVGAVRRGLRYRRRAADRAPETGHLQPADRHAADAQVLEGAGHEGANDGPFNDRRLHGVAGLPRPRRRDGQPRAGR
jgi:hypothetical protein